MKIELGATHLIGEITKQPNTNHYFIKVGHIQVGTFKQAQVPNKEIWAYSSIYVNSIIPYKTIEQCKDRAIKDLAQFFRNLQPREKTEEEFGPLKLKISDYRIELQRIEDLLIQANKKNRAYKVIINKLTKK